MSTKTQRRYTSSTANEKKRKRSEEELSDGDDDFIVHDEDESMDIESGEDEGDDSVVATVKSDVEIEDLVKPNVKQEASYTESIVKRSRSKSLKEPPASDGQLASPHSTDMHDFSSEEVSTIRQSLLDWYDKVQRLMPWRKPSEAFIQSCQSLLVVGDYYSQTDSQFDHSYGVIVSELMLQQTQVATVKAYFVKWMREFPTVQALASATPERVNEMWAGLGYYRRARLLHQCAKEIVDKHGGVIPRTASELEELPGIGKYTAGAVASIAFGQVTPLVDGNVIRVLARLRAIAADPKNLAVTKLFWKLAADIVDPTRPGDFNQALMELGATLCTPQTPQCAVCPVQSVCVAYKQVQELQPRINSIAVSAKAVTTPESQNSGWCRICTGTTRANSVIFYPIKTEKKKPKDLVTIVGVVKTTPANNNDPLYLVTQRPPSGLLAGFWEFPSVDQIGVKEGDDKAEEDEPSAQVPSFHERQATIDAYVARLLPNGIGNHVSEVVRGKRGSFVLVWLRAVAAAASGRTKKRLRRPGGMLPKMQVARTDVGTTNHLFSHIKQTLVVEMIEYKGPTDLIDVSSGTTPPTTKWVSESEFLTLAISKGMKKCLELIKKPPKTRIAKKASAGAKAHLPKRLKRNELPAQETITKPTQRTLTSMFKPISK